MNIVWEIVGVSLGNSDHFSLWIRIFSFLDEKKETYFYIPLSSQYEKLHYNIVAKKAGVWGKERLEFDWF